MKSVAAVAEATNDDEVGAMAVRKVVGLMQGGDRQREVLDERW